MVDKQKNFKSNYIDVIYNEKDNTYGIYVSSTSDNEYVILTVSKTDVTEI